VGASNRPIFFYTTFWGNRFRNYFANALLRSLLAPENFPRLDRAAGHKFLICCPADDWSVLHSHPAFLQASRYVEMVHVSTNAPLAGVHPVDHMAEGHASAAAICQLEKAYGSLLHPDMLFADGFVRNLEQHIANGTQALLVPALRLADAPIFAKLDIDAEYDSGEPLIFTPRQVIAAVTTSLHDEIIECEMDGPRFSMLPNCVWWRNGDRGLLVHSFTWSPLLIDHSAIQSHVLEGLCGPIPDGDYVARNFSTDANIAFVSDSDEIAFASWTPAAVGARESRKSLFQNLPLVGRLLRNAILRRAYLHYTRDFYPYGDHVKARGFKIALKLHTTELDGSWDILERIAMREIMRSGGDLFDPPAAPATLRTRILDWLLRFLKPYEVCQRVQASLRFASQRFIAAAKGDHAARSWIYNRVRARLNKLG
jgi:hypothetical protein